MYTNSIFLKQAVTYDTDHQWVEEIINALKKKTPNEKAINYKHLYFFLFNGITEIIDSVNDSETITALKKLHCDAEDLFIE